MCVEIIPNLPHLVPLSQQSEGLGHLQSSPHEQSDLPQALHTEAHLQASPHLQSAPQVQLAARIGAVDYIQRTRSLKELHTNCTGSFSSNFSHFLLLRGFCSLFFFSSVVGNFR